MPVCGLPEWNPVCWSLFAWWNLGLALSGADLSTSIFCWDVPGLNWTNILGRVPGCLAFCSFVLWRHYDLGQVISDCQFLLCKMGRFVRSNQRHSSTNTSPNTLELSNISMDLGMGTFDALLGVLCSFRLYCRHLSGVRVLQELNGFWPSSCWSFHPGRSNAFYLSLSQLSEASYFTKPFLFDFKRENVCEVLRPGASF